MALAAAMAPGDPVTALVFALAVVLAAAKLGGHLAIRLGQPAVLGELLAGVLVGNAHLAGVPWFTQVGEGPAMQALAGLGVIILLFEVGLESTVRDMMRVGMRALFVALLGVLAPFALGWAVGAALLPDHSAYAHAFLGATLTATSVGITARVLKDLDRSSTAESRVILGAAVIDDVLGLVILAAVSGIIAAADTGGSLSYLGILWILAKAVLFLAGALAIGLLVSPRLFGLAAHLRGRGVLLATALIFCFLLAYLASRIGLAPIVGAYAAGLILEDVHYVGFRGREVQLEHLLRPIASFLVPVFFVMMGMRVDLASLVRPEILGLAALLTLAAIAGKQACSLAALGGRIDPLVIGIGMVPRGEVGLIFANIGLTLFVGGERVVDEGVYAAVVIMVIVTTMMTPPALRWSLDRAQRGERGALSS